ncbi:AIPR family protein [Acetobacter aceti]|uniref:Abortive phage infection protein C-terminal domain-containing protein n=1 Tax=Acetobacter aceti TaxID=435 RepID=A0A6S6PCZ9_ACEAC|nr:AIPR family protein [Acetobacter aceti]BCI65538.1 hypothetical protein AAJCM20276_01620 [Acetobacter aceti]
MSELSNSQIIMERIIKDEAAEQGMKYEEFFELYSASQILKDYEITYSDIEYSIVGNGNDGGIDSIYTFLNGELIKEDTEYTKNGRNSKIEVVIIQSKTSKSFKEDAVVKFNEVTRDLFNISTDLNDDRIQKTYNRNLIDRVSIFRRLYTDLMKGFPDVKFIYYYATMGEEVHHKVEAKGLSLKATITSMFTGAFFSLEFINASKLVELNRKVKSTSRTMELSESPITTINGSYLCLVNLRKYYDFISDNDSLSRSIFESNVRDHNKNVVVNVEIQNTLKNGKEDFWFLNNGVTVITSKAVLSGKTLTIENPQIVNGLQTSHEIFNFYSQIDESHDELRNILVRVIHEDNSEARDRIIRATNSQTSIPPASLRSADEIHRDIEDYFKTYGLYYDRRKNFYKNEGKLASKIVSIPFLAQCVMSVVLLQPNNARARPSTLINDSLRYKQIFNKKYPLDLYVKAYLFVKRVENLMKKEQITNRSDFNNIVYHLSMYCFINTMKPKDKNDIIQKIPNFKVNSLSEEQFIIYIRDVKKLYEKLGGNDNTAKGTKFVETLLDPKKMEQELYDPFIRQTLITYIGSDTF